MFGTQKHNRVDRLSGIPCGSTAVVPTFAYLISAQNQAYPGSSSIHREAKAMKSRKPRKLVDFSDIQEAKESRSNGSGSHKPRALPGSPMTRLGDLLSEQSLIALGHWYQGFQKKMAA